MVQKQYTYAKSERLKSAQTIELLFEKGKTIKAFPLKLIYMATSFDDTSKVKAAVSVSKRLVNRASHRNRVKRIMREAYRLNKASFFNKITTQYAFMFLYIGSDEADFDAVNKAMKDLLQRFCDKELKNLP